MEPNRFYEETVRQPDRANSDLDFKLTAIVREDGSVFFLDDPAEFESGDYEPDEVRELDVYESAKYLAQYLISWAEGDSQQDHDIVRTTLVQAASLLRDLYTAEGN